jgi:hypothetical protein
VQTGCPLHRRVCGDVEVYDSPRRDSLGRSSMIAMASHLADEFPLGEIQTCISRSTGRSPAPPTPGCRSNVARHILPSSCESSRIPLLPTYSIRPRIRRCALLAPERMGAPPQKRARGTAVFDRRNHCRTFWPAFTLTIELRHCLLLLCIIVRCVFFSSLPTSTVDEGPRAYKAQASKSTDSSGGFRPHTQERHPSRRGTGPN